MTLTIMVMVLTLSMVTVAFADQVEIVASGDTTAEQLTQYLESNIGSAAWLNAYITDDANNGNANGDFIVLSSGTYYLRPDITPSAFLTRLTNSYKSSKVTEDTVNITDGINIKADTTGATTALSGFVPVINMLLGVITVLITIGLAVFTAFDVCYIVFPVFRNKCEDAKVQGQGMMVQKTANGGTKLRWVSDEAQFSVNHASLEQGSNPLTTYLKHRVLAYIIVSIILFVLLTGNISIITNIALKLVSGLMDVLNGLA